MKENIQTYFHQERTESLIFLTMGIIALLISAWFWYSGKPEFYKGMLWPLVLVGLIQIVVGATVYFRSPADAARVTQWVDNDNQRVISEEVPRMEKVMLNFRVYRYVEIILMLGGLLLILFFKEPVFWKGVGAGLFAQAGLMLAADFFAERRGSEYLEQLRHWIAQLS